MQNTFLASTTNDLHEPSVSNDALDGVSHLMHALSNKLLPITVFSQLALRHCEDPRVLKHLEKIHRAAEEARAIVVQIQRLDQTELPASTPSPSSTEASSAG